MLIVLWEIVQFLLNLLVVLLSEFKWGLLEVIIVVSMIYEGTEISLDFKLS